MMGLLLSPNLVLADCNIKTDVVRKDNFVAYSYDCNKMVGKLIKDEEDRKEQVKKLNEAIKFKDLALDFSNKEKDLWRNEAQNQYDILQRHAKYRSYEKWVWFGGGIGLTILSVWAAGQLR